MQIKLLTNLGSNEFPEHRYLDGEEHDVDPSLGERLVRRGLAVDITPQPAASTPTIAGVSIEPELKAVPQETIKPTSAKPKKTGD